MAAKLERHWALMRVDLKESLKVTLMAWHWE
jgi:hypothetical protein